MTQSYYYNYNYYDIYYEYFGKIEISQNSKQSTFTVEGKITELTRLS